MLQTIPLCGNTIVSWKSLLIGGITVDADQIKRERMVVNALKSPDRFRVVCITYQEKAEVDLLELAEEMNFSANPNNCHFICRLHIQNISV